MSRKTVSEKQVAANRRNALKSTGPQTPEGKARSSRNAIKHGILAQEVVIRAGDGAEDPKQFEALLEQFCNELQPAGILEEALVERIAVSYWRLRRAQRFEVGAIRERLDACTRPPVNFAALETNDVERELESAKTALVQEQKLLAWAKQQKDLTARNAWEALEEAWDDVLTEMNLPDEEYPETEKELHQFLERMGLTGDQLRPRLLEAQRRVIAKARQEVDRVEAKLCRTRHYEQLARERAALVCALPPESDVNRLIRYETMINRQLDRALNQLERLQRARQGDHVPAPVTLDVNVSGVKEAG